MPMVRRTETGSRSGAYRSSPSSSTVPSIRPPRITSCRRFRVRSTVDLPQPDGPMNAVTERGSTLIETPSTALKSP